MNVFRLLLILFLCIPLIEIYLLIKVGSLIGAIPTVLLVVGTAILGAVLLRMQGFSTMYRVRSMLAHGELPAVEMLEGVVLLISGALLLTPGFFTDTIGFLGLLPALRRAAVIWFLKHNAVIATSSWSKHQSSVNPHGPKTIEGEFWRDDRHH